MSSTYWVGGIWGKLGEVMRHAWDAEGRGRWLQLVPWNLFWGTDLSDSEKAYCTA